MKTGAQRIPCVFGVGTAGGDIQLVEVPRGNMHAAKYFTCDVCKANFPTRASLRVHARTHTGERPYTCDQCPASFNQQANLCAHKRIHTEERPYLCEKCGAKFKQRGHLTKHMRMHTDERPFSCEECSSRFRSNENLTVHKRIHSGVKPFNCPECSKSCADRSNFRKHLSTHRVSKQEGNRPVSSRSQLNGSFNPVAGSPRQQCFTSPVVHCTSPPEAERVEELGFQHFFSEFAPRRRCI